jgi:hypothetical protein
MPVTTGKKFLTVVAIFGALCVVAAAAVYEHTDVMERKSAVSFKVTELEHANIPVVSISGSSATGYMSVKNVSTRTVGSSIDVCVHIFLARSGTSGTFRFDAVTSGINQIRFGNDKVVIWKRNLKDSQTANLQRG